MSVRWLPADWPAPQAVIAGTTLRGGGASEGAYASLNLASHVGDRTERVLENRRRFADALGLPAEPRWLDQTHSVNVALEQPGPAAEGTDALVATGDEAVCVVLTADCLPVLFTASDGSAIAAAHAGWRGLCNGILESTAETLLGLSDDVIAWLGPAISQPAFEVGEEVREQFLVRDAGAAACFSRNSRGRFQADLYELARRRLAAAGIRRVYGGGRCTFREPQSFYSYRRDGQCGRMASFIFRRP